MGTRTYAGITHNAKVMEDEGQPATLFLPSLEFGRQHDGISGDDPSYIKKCAFGIRALLLLLLFFILAFHTKVLIIASSWRSYDRRPQSKIPFFCFHIPYPTHPPVQRVQTTRPCNKSQQQVHSASKPKTEKKPRAAMGGPQPVFTASRKPQVVAAGGRRGERSQAKEIKNRSAAGSQGAASGSPAMKLKLKN